MCYKLDAKKILNLRDVLCCGLQQHDQHDQIASCVRLHYDKRKG